MRIYKLSASDRHEWLDPEDQEAYKRIQELTGESDPGWRPLAVTLINRDNHGRLADSDFPLLSGYALTLRIAAAGSLSNVIQSAGARVPLRTREGVAMTLFIPRPIDALDEDRSEIRRYPSSNKIMLVKRAAFLPERLGSVDIFHLAHQGSAIYVTDKFVSQVNAANLRGLDFDEQWSDEG